MVWIILSILLPFSGVKVHHALLTGIAISVCLDLLPIKVQKAFNRGSREKNFSKKILQLGVVLLGVCLPLNEITSFGASGLIITFISIIAILLLGSGIGRIFGLNKSITTLISFGTAICGGSAIAAITPVIKAKNQDVAIAMVLVFILNAIALFIFPLLGEYFNLTDIQFGKWAALSIHDTSSVIAASSLWSEKALTIATTLKLVRALWIAPFTFFIAMRMPQKTSRVKIPLFIFAFLIVSILASIFPVTTNIQIQCKYLAKIAMASSLFLIGLSLKVEQMKNLKVNTIFHALTLWVVVSSVSLFLISSNII